MIGNMNLKDNSSMPFLQSQLLLAMPNMGDPRFHRSVIFLCVHDEKGAMGIAINNPLPSPDFTALLEQVGIPVENVPRQKIQVLAGGPVESGRGFLLHTTDFHEKDTIVVDDQFAVSGTIDTLKQIVEGHKPKHMLFALGYAGWGAGQLEREVQENAWFTVPATYDLVFNSKPELMWEKAFASMGINPAQISAEAGRA